MLAATVLASDLTSLGNKPVIVVSPAHQGMSDGGMSGALNLRVMPKFTTVSAASFALDPSPLTADSVAAGFGTGLASSTGFAPGTPLPTNLNGTEVRVTDSAGTERPAGLFFVTGLQVNYQMPPGTADGVATAVVTLNGNIVSAGPVVVTGLSPGLFTFRGDGTGVVAGVVLRAQGANQTTELIFRIDNGAIVPAPINMGPPTDLVYLIIFGTGMRKNSGASNISVDFGGGITKTLSSSQFEGCFAAPGLIGVDQCNVLLPRSLIGRGLINFKMTLDGKTTNTGQFAVQ